MESSLRMRVVAAAAMAAIATSWVSNFQNTESRRFYFNMASRVIRSTIRLQSTMAAPIVTSEPATLVRHEKAIAPRHSKSAKPSRRPAYYPIKRKLIKLPDLPSFVEPPYDPVPIPPVLTFSFEQAKQHLIEADGRFEMMFAQLKRNPFGLWKRPVDPFRSLVNHTLNQYTPRPVTKSGKGRFLRLFDRSIPQKITRGTNYTFPSPGRLASVDENILKAIGFSETKAESVLDIANRFADGRLSTQTLADASDEKLMEMLSDVRGIGELTAGRFAIFFLRRPDILLVGDLEIQKGLLNWVISSHEPDRYPLRFNPKRFFESNGGGPKKLEESKAAEPGEDASVLPVPGESPTSTTNVSSTSLKQPNGVLPIPKAPVQLPEGMTLEMLKARADNQEAEGGCYLFPSEMEALTASWKPYRSLGVFCLGSVMHGPK